MQPQQPGYNSSRVYLDLLADLPWQKASEEMELDLRAAQKRLDSDHYGLVKVKQRIIEYLAVRKVANYSVTMPVNLYWIVKFNVFLILVCMHHSLNQMQGVQCCVLLGRQVSGKHHWHLLLLLLWEESLSAYPLVESRMRPILEDIGEHMLEACLDGL
jgi:hypothetical protein